MKWNRLIRIILLNPLAVTDLNVCYEKDQWTHLLLALLTWLFAMLLSNANYILSVLLVSAVVDQHLVQNMDRKAQLSCSSFSEIVYDGLHCVMNASLDIDSLTTAILFAFNNSSHVSNSAFTPCQQNSLPLSQDLYHHCQLVARLQVKPHTNEDCVYCKYVVFMLILFFI